MSQPTKDDLRRVILEVAVRLKVEREAYTWEFVGAAGPRLEKTFDELERKCLDALGDPTVAECDRLRGTGGAT